MAENTLLDEYVTLPQRYIASGGLDKDEIDYKIRLVEDIAKAREAVLAHADDWPDVVKQLCKNKKMHRKKGETKGIIDGMNIRALESWIDSDQSDALDAFQALWAKGDTPINDRIILDRIRDFVPRVRVHPADPKLKNGFTGGGVRMKVTSAFLMVLDPWKYPPYKSIEFKEAYNRTGYPKQPKYADEVYEHALGFLDELIERAGVLGFARPSNRLEAQSIVWSYRYPERFVPKQPGAGRGRAS